MSHTHTPQVGTLCCNHLTMSLVNLVLQRGCLLNVAVLLNKIILLHECLTNQITDVTSQIIDMGKESVKYTVS